MGPPVSVQEAGIAGIDDQGMIGGSEEAFSCSTLKKLTWPTKVTGSTQIFENFQGFCASRVDNKRCLKMVYFSFQKIQEESEEDATVNSNSVTGGEEKFATEMV